MNLKGISLFGLLLSVGMVHDVFAPFPTRNYGQFKNQSSFDQTDQQEEFMQFTQNFMRDAKQAINDIAKRVTNIENRLNNGGGSYSQDPLDKHLDNLMQAFVPRNPEEIEKYRKAAGKVVGGFTRALDSITLEPGALRQSATSYKDSSDRG